MQEGRHISDPGEAPDEPQRRMGPREPVRGIHLLPHATLHKIMLEVALLQAGPKQQWQQGAALCVLARVSRSWRDLAGDDELWRSLCEGPEHWLIQPRASLSLSTSQSVARSAAARWRTGCRGGKPGGR